MSNSPSAVTNPFEPTALDEETELRALARALQFAQGFKLLFVRCNRHDQRQRLVAALQTQLPQLTVQEIHFDAPIVHLLDELRERLIQPSPDAVFVSGLEYSLPTAANAYATPFVANLNAARNSFPQVVPCPLVLWAPEYVLTTITRGAPDFFSIRSGVYYFAATPEETAHLIESMTVGEEWMTANLLLAERQERISAIKSLLTDYQVLSPTQRDRYAEARLLTRLGSLYFTLGRWAEAEAAFQQSLAIVREVGDRIGEGRILNNLGVVHKAQGRWTEAEECYQQDLAICREVGDRIGEGRTLNNLGNVYEAQGRWAEAEAAFQQSLAIQREVGDRIGEGRILNNLGVVHKAQGRWTEAEECYQQDLAICREVGDRIGEGRTLSNLGNVYRQQGRWTEAEECYQQSLAILQEYGDRVGEGKTLENLALLREAQGKMMEALEFERKALQVLKTTEDEAAKEKARRLVAEWEGRGRSAEGSTTLANNKSS